MRGSEQKKKTRQIVAAKIMCTPVEIFMTPSARARRPKERKHSTTPSFCMVEKFVLKLYLDEIFILQKVK